MRMAGGSGRSAQGPCAQARRRPCGQASAGSGAPAAVPERSAGGQGIPPGRDCGRDGDGARGGLQRQRVLRAPRRWCGAARPRPDGGVADGVLGLDVVAQAGGTALHHAAQGVPAVAAGARLRRLRRPAGAGCGRGPSSRRRPGSRPGRGRGPPPRGRRRPPAHRRSPAHAPAPGGRAWTRRLRWTPRARPSSSMLASTKARKSSRSSRRSTSVSSPPSGRAAARGGRPAARRLAMLQPVLGAGTLPRAPPAAEQRRHQVGRLGRHGAGEGEGHGERYRGI